MHLVSLKYTSLDRIECVLFRFLLSWLKPMSPALATIGLVCLTDYYTHFHMEKKSKPYPKFREGLLWETKSLVPLSITANEAEEALGRDMEN